MVLAFLKLLEILVIFLVKWATHTSRSRPNDFLLVYLRRAISLDGPIFNLDAFSGGSDFICEINYRAICQEFIVLHGVFSTRIIHLILEVLERILRNSLIKRLPLNAVRTHLGNFGLQCGLVPVLGKFLAALPACTSIDPLFGAIVVFDVIKL